MEMTLVVITSCTRIFLTLLIITCQYKNIFPLKLVVYLECRYNDSMFWLNFKTYERGTGDKALEIAKICEEVSQESGVSIFVCPQYPDIYRLAQKVNIEIWAQHIDEVKYGKHTGWVLPEAVATAGASGTLINHAERRLSFEGIKKRVERAKEVGLKTMVCTDNLEAAKRIESLRPDYLAFEDPDLIAGDVSIAFAEPEKTKRVIEEVKELPIVVGAGVKTTQDVKRSLELGATGVLVSSGVMLKAEDPKLAVSELVAGFK